MIRNIVKDPLFLSGKSLEASPTDKSIAEDLKDTLRANASRCVGMAANMIGQRKRILVFDGGFMPVIMYNPIILQKAEMYETEEGCLSLIGERKTTRWKEITVEYYNEQWKKTRMHFTGFTAQIIQHEMDHFEGKLI